MRNHLSALLASLGMLLSSTATSAQLCNCPDDPAVSRIQIAREAGRTVVTGRVVELETLRGVRAAQVYSRELGGALSDSVGGFRLQLPFVSDTITLRIERIGYHAVDVAIAPETTALTFIFRRFELPLCDLVVGNFPPPGVHFIPLDKSNQRLIERDASVKVFNWESGSSSTLTVKEGSTTLALAPGVYDITAEVRGYEPWFARRYVVELEPCNSSRILHRTINAWLDPLP